MTRASFMAVVGAALRSFENRLLVFAALAGGLAFGLFGETPATSDNSAGPEAEWALPALASGPGPEVDAAWQKGVWVSQASVAASATGVAPPPTFTLRGVIRSGDRFEALIEGQDGQRVRVAEGEGLPGGGTLTRLSPTEARWTDAAGNQVTQRLLDAPPQPTAR